MIASYSNFVVVGKKVCLKLSLNGKSMFKLFFRFHKCFFTFEFGSTSTTAEDVFELVSVGKRSRAGWCPSTDFLQKGGVLNHWSTVR